MWGPVSRILVAALRTFLAVFSSWFLAFFADWGVNPLFSPPTSIQWWAWGLLALSYGPVVFLWKTSSSQIGKWLASAVAAFLPIWVTIEGIQAHLWLI